MIPLLLSLLAPAISSAAPATEIARAEGAHIQRPSWSPDAARLAYEVNHHDERRIDLYVGDASGPFGRVRVASATSTALSGFSTRSEAGRVTHEIAWSPPAIGRFVYTASSSAADYGIHLDGGSALADAPGADGGAAWSPDGRWIVFTSARTGEGDLYVLDTHHVAEPPTRLTHTEHTAELYASWSPDSAGLAWTAHDSAGDHVWWLPAFGQAPVRLTSWSGNQLLPSFSPDGRRIAFYANTEEEDRFDLWVVAARPGAEPVLVARSVVTDASGPSWDPSGRFLVYTEANDALFDPICVVPVDFPLSRQVVPLDTVGHGDLDVARAADGSIRIAYVAAGRSGGTDNGYRRLFTSTLDLP